jgi:AcrR family transcriptional regulator
MTREHAEVNGIGEIAGRCMARVMRPDTMRTGDSAAARRIREAGVAEFARHGYGASTTRDIAARVGLSAAAMYPHYRSKEELLYAISLDGHHGALQALRSADLPASPPLERLKAVVAAFAEWQAEHAELARVVQYEIRSLSPAHYRRIQRLRRDTVDILREILVVGSESEDFDAQPIDGVLLAISSLCVDVCRWFPSGRLREPRQVGNLYANLAARMVRRAADAPPRVQP